MKYIFSVICIMFISACGTDDPKPPEALGKLNESVEVTSPVSILSSDSVTVRHTVKKQDVYVEVIVPGFTFSSKESKKHVEGQGYLKIFLNDKQIDEIHQAAFIVKGLPAGKHKLKIELVKNDETSYGIQKEMEIMIK